MKNNSSSGLFAIRHRFGRRSGFTIVLILLCCQVRLVAQNADYGVGFAADFPHLPYFKNGVQTYQFSSTDPKEDQFNDYAHWLYSDKDSGAVLADIQGPGTIYRIWSTGNVGDTNRLKMYFDGEATPRIDETFNRFHGHKPLRDHPQVGSGGDHFLAWWSYMPIPFKKSIKIVREGNFRPFYAISYHTYTDNKNVKSWTPKDDVSRLETMWNDVTTDPKPRTGNRTELSSVRLNKGESKQVFQLTGKGSIAAIKISHYLPDKQLRLKIFWDDDSTAAVDAPVKWFFGSVDNGGDVKALGVGTIGNNGYCYFPMPFWKKARMILENNSDTVTATMDIEVSYNTHAYPENDCAYFHAAANETDKPNGRYRCLSTGGHGHIIGMAKRMPKGGHACEGDEIYFIDERKFPDIYGTGEEDYSNNAWWQNSYNSYPTHGCIGNDCYYRMHYPDLIVFENGIDMEFESWQNFYTSSLVWYYAKEKPSLVKTDSIDILNERSEKQHLFTIQGETWKGENRGVYPGIRIYRDSITDGGRTFSSACSFDVSIGKKNKGVRLRARTDHANFQGVEVYIDGRKVKERPWVIVKNNYEALWTDSDFDIPAGYTKDKSRIRVTLKDIRGHKNWTAYRYEAFSYRGE